MISRATIAIAALLFGAAPALADFTLRTDSTVTTVRCHPIYGCTVTRAPLGSGNSARVIRVPADDVPPNTSDTWGGGCRSCVDLQPRPSATFESGR
jgi:hypothetical protein